MDAEPTAVVGRDQVQIAVPVKICSSNELQAREAREHVRAAKGQRCCCLTNAAAAPAAARGRLLPKVVQLAALPRRGQHVRMPVTVQIGRNRRLGALHGACAQRLRRVAQGCRGGTFAAEEENGVASSNQQSCAAPCVDSEPHCWPDLGDSVKSQRCGIEPQYILCFN